MFLNPLAVEIDRPPKPDDLVVAAQSRR